MRKTVYLRDDIDSDVVEYIKKLEQNKENVSAFFVNAAKYYLEHHKADSKDIESIVREIIEKEYKNVPQGLYESENDIKNELANKLKGIYD